MPENKAIQKTTFWTAFRYKEPPCAEVTEGGMLTDHNCSMKWSLSLAYFLAPNPFSAFRTLQQSSAWRLHQQGNLFIVGNKHMLTVLAFIIPCLYLEFKSNHTRDDKQYHRHDD